GGAAIVAALVSGAVRLRVALRAIRRSPESQWMLFVAAQLLCGIVLAVLLVLFERVLGRSVDPSTVDLRHFSLHPSTATRLATLIGVLLGHAPVLWGGALACTIALAGGGRGVWGGATGARRRCGAPRSSCSRSPRPRAASRSRCRLSCSARAFVR